MLYAVGARNARSSGSSTSLLGIRAGKSIRGAPPGSGQRQGTSVAGVLPATCQASPPGESMVDDTAKWTVPTELMNTNQNA